MICQARALLLILLLALFGGRQALTLAQDSEELRAEGQVTRESGPFGLTQTLARGTVSNAGAHSYRDIRITVLAYDEVGALLGEGEGYLTQACGAALTDYRLLPGAAASFVAPLDLEPEAAIAHTEIQLAGQREELAAARPDTAFRLIGSGEAVALEWLSPARLRYGAGCATAPFTQLDWWEYDLLSGELAAVAHPLSERMDEQFRAASGIDRYTQSGERDDALYESSMLRGQGEARRVVYRNDLGHIMTAELDGTYPRIVDKSSFRNTLQGIEWLGQGRFVAYSYGAAGDAVRYVSGHVDGARLSEPLALSMPSQTRPGVSGDGLLFALGLADAQPPGYYLRQTRRDDLQLMYETALPGNNAPAPILFRVGERRLAYLIVSAEEQPAAPSAEQRAAWQLLCLDRDTGFARAISDLPILLPPEQRAWLSRSPDGRALALAADGGRGGLWLLEVAEAPC